jgi:hypothetical protein
MSLSHLKEWEKRRMRKNLWYKRFKIILDTIKGKCPDGDAIELMSVVYQTINKTRGFHYDHIAVSAESSLELLLEDNFPNYQIAKGI